MSQNRTDEKCDDLQADFGVYYRRKYSSEEYAEEETG